MMNSSVFVRQETLPIMFFFYVPLFSFITNPKILFTFLLPFQT